MKRLVKNINSWMLLLKILAQLLCSIYLKATLFVLGEQYNAILLVVNET